MNRIMRSVLLILSITFIFMTQNLFCMKKQKETRRDRFSNLTFSEYQRTVQRFRAHSFPVTDRKELKKPTQETRVMCMGWVKDYKSNRYVLFAGTRDNQLLRYSDQGSGFSKMKLCNKDKGQIRRIAVHPVNRDTFAFGFDVDEKSCIRIYTYDEGYLKQKVACDNIDGKVQHLVWLGDENPILCVAMLEPSRLFFMDIKNKKNHFVEIARNNFMGQVCCYGSSASSKELVVLCKKIMYKLVLKSDLSEVTIDPVGKKYDKSLCYKACCFAPHRNYVALVIQESAGYGICVCKKDFTYEVQKETNCFAGLRYKKHDFGYPNVFWDHQVIRSPFHGIQWHPTKKDWLAILFRDELCIVNVKHKTRTTFFPGENDYFSSFAWHPTKAFKFVVGYYSGKVEQMELDCFNQIELKLNLFL